MSAAVRAAGVVHDYGDRRALDGLDLSVAAGTVTAVLGPNGAGKTTFLQQICGLVPVRRGTVEVFGLDVTADALEVRRGLGVVFQQPTLDADLTVRENLVLHGRLFGLSRRDARARAEALLGDFGLAERAGSRVLALSGGLARRVELVRALLHGPRLLVLDEPTTGLDPEARAAFWDGVRGRVAARGLTVLFSTHYLDEAEVSDEIHLVAGGRRVASGGPAALRARLGTGAVHLAADAPLLLCGALRAEGFDAAVVPGGVVVPHPDPASVAPRLCALADRAGLPADRVELRTSSLDEVFLGLVEAAP